MDEERETRWRAWMVAAQAGDPVSYEKLLLELLPMVRRFVANRIFETSAVEDVVQNVFVSVHRARHTYRSERPFRPWLYAIARNAVIDHTRARARRSRRKTTFSPSSPPLFPRTISAADWKLRTPRRSSRSGGISFVSATCWTT